MTSDCPFCALPIERIWLENAHAIAFPDGYPLADGHTLIIPRRHRISVFDAAPEELAALWALVAEVRARLQEKLEPDGFNVGINDGSAAGQTILHGHIHVIPRKKGDVPDPRGGVRWIIPARANYWDDRSR